MRVAVTNLTTAGAALCLSLTGRERWEVVVEQETLIAAVTHTVDHLLVELGAECTGSQRHRLTTLEDSGSVRHGQRDTSHQIGRMSSVHGHPYAGPRRGRSGA
jgi:hypothetical protein